MGRPTNSPKVKKLDFRVSEQELQVLDDYCEKYKKTRAEGIRDGISCLPTHKQKK